MFYLQAVLLLISAVALASSVFVALVGNEPAEDE